jgi:hypothetical protein
MRRLVGWLLFLICVFLGIAFGVVMAYISTLIMP